MSRMCRQGVRVPGSPSPLRPRKPPRCAISRTTVLQLVEDLMRAVFEAREVQGPRGKIHGTVPAPALVQDHARRLGSVV